MVSGMPSKITNAATLDEIQKLLERTKLDMEQVQHLVAVIRSNGFTQSSLKTNNVMQNETVGTIINSPESITSKMCNFAPMFAKHDGKAKRQRRCQ